MLERWESSIYSGGSILIAPEIQTKAAPKARTKKEEKVTIEIDARFAPVDRGGRGRGGDRGRGRGDRGSRGSGFRGRGGADQPRAGGRTSTAVDVSDESAFPSLS
jgi:plasminogen activator inhibitor 1 RNA-binding protein